MNIPIREIILDTTLQMRASIRTALIDEYAECLDELPPCRVFKVAGKFYLTRGWHRHGAHVKAGRTTIPCEVFDGTMEEAFVDALGDNATHGLRRSDEDKTRAVTAAIRRPTLSEASDREIAKLCVVSHNFVTEVKKRLASATPAPAPSAAAPDGLCTACKRRLRVGQSLLPSCPMCKSIANGSTPPPAETPPILPSPPPRVSSRTPPLCKRCLEVGVRVDGCAACKRMETTTSSAREEPVTDDAGVVVPVRLVPVFAAREDFDKAMRLLTSCANAFQEIEKGDARHLKLKDGRHYTKYFPVFKAARAMLKSLRPSKVCHNCGGDSCDHCQDGVLTAEAANV